MIIKLEDKIYDSRDLPILLILSDEEKEHLSNMSEADHLYLSYPHDYNDQDSLNRIIKEGTGILDENIKDIRES